MSDRGQISLENAFFKEQYQTILQKFLLENKAIEDFSTDIQQFGHQAVSKKFNILSILVIHEECLMSCLEQTDKRLGVTEKARSLLDCILTAYQEQEKFALST